MTPTDKELRYAELLEHAHRVIFADNPQHYFIEQLELIEQARESVWSSVSRSKAREEVMRTAAEADARREAGLRKSIHEAHEQIRSLERKIWAFENSGKDLPFGM